MIGCERVRFALVSRSQRIQPGVNLEITFFSLDYYKLKRIPERIRRFALGSFKYLIVHIFMLKQSLIYLKKFILQ